MKDIFVKEIKNDSQTESFFYLKYININNAKDKQ